MDFFFVVPCCNSTIANSSALFIYFNSSDILNQGCVCPATDKLVVVARVYREGLELNTMKSLWDQMLIINKCRRACFSSGPSLGDTNTTYLSPFSSRVWPMYS